MDEFFNIEKSIGEVVAIIGLQFNYENQQIEERDVRYEEFKVQEIVKKEPKYDDDGVLIPEEEVPAEEEGEKKAPKFKPEEYGWTITDRCPKNLPQLFNQCKGVNTINDTKTAEKYSSS